MEKYILITGVAGLLGSNMADYILHNEKDYGVIGIDNLFGGYLSNINNEVIFYQRDLSKDNINDIFENHNVEYVFHFAAYAAEGLSPFMRMFNWENNSVSTANIINCCIKYKVKRLIYTSSTSVYGYGKCDETETPKPIDPYGISKYACEMDIQVAGEQHNLDWCIIRPHNIYGEKQNIWDRYRNVIGIWMFQILNKQPITIYGDGEQTRAFTYISDILKPLWNAAVFENASKEIINLGGTKTYSINEVAKVLCNITHYEKVIYEEPRYEVMNISPTYQKSIDILGYKNETDLMEGISRMWEWAKVQTNRERFKWDNYEITNGLYSYWL